MAKATLINPQGKKVVVPTGSQQAQQYFNQGYQLMGASGQYQAPATPSPTPATPAPTPQPQTPQPQPTSGPKATLYNPQTGQKVVVTSGSQQAKDYFGQGFQLFTGQKITPTQPVQPTQTGPQATLYNPTTGQKVVVPSGSQEAQEYFGKGYKLFKKLDVSAKDLEGGLKSDYLTDTAQAEETIAENAQLGDIYAGRPADSIEGFVSGADATLQDIDNIVAALTAPTEAGLRQDQLIGRMEQLLPQLVGRGAREQELLTEAGYNEVVKNLQDVNVQISQVKSQYDKAIAGIQDSPLSTSYIAGVENKMRRNAAIELGALTSLAQAYQGNIEMAERTAKKTVDLEFEPVEQELENLKVMLDLNKEKMNTEEKKQALKLELVLQEREKQIQEQKQEKSNIMNLATVAAQNGADISTLNEVMKAGNYEDALKAVGSYIRPPVDTSSDMPASYQEWLLAGGDSSGYSYGEWVKGKAYGVGTAAGDVTPEMMKDIAGTDQAKALTSLQDLKAAVNQYKSYIEQNKDKGFAMFGEEKAVLDALYSNLQIKYKEAANLGALTGPDLDLLAKALKPISGGPIDYAKYLSSGGVDGVLASLESSLEGVDDAAKRNYDTLTLRFGENSYVNNLGQGFGFLGNQTGPSMDYSTLPPLNQAYVSLDALVNDYPEYLGLINDLERQNPSWSDDDILQFITYTDFSSDLGTSVKGLSSKTGKLSNGATTLAKLGSGIITGIDGSKYWKPGLDFVISGGKGAKVPSPFSGTVVKAVAGYHNPVNKPQTYAKGKSQNGGFGNQVKIRLDDGNEIWFSHLDDVYVQEGQRIYPGQMFGTQGNTGLTYGNTGTHLDITMKKPDGSKYTAREVAVLLGDKHAFS